MTLTQLHLVLLGGLCLTLSSLAQAQAGSQLGERWASAPLRLDGSTNSDASSPTSQGYPAGFFALPENIENLIWVELNAGKLHLIEQLAKDNYRTIKTIPISIGKNGSGKEIEGDKRTPIGIYHVTRYIPESELTDFYGLGAYPINYPNAWDKLQARTGYGIWLHGLPKGIEQRPLLDSDGCVVLDNQSLSYLDDNVTPGETLVILGNDLRWINASTNSSEAENERREQEQILAAFKSWEANWESRDIQSYLSNYHVDFSDFRHDLTSWSDYKSRINRAKSFIDVDISQLSVIRYPGSDDLIRFHFYQEYRSSNYDWSGWKEMLWQKDSEGNWKIAYEGNG